MHLSFFPLFVYELEESLGERKKGEEEEEKCFKISQSENKQELIFVIKFYSGSENFFLSSRAVSLVVL